MFIFGANREFQSSINISQKWCAIGSGIGWKFHPILIGIKKSKSKVDFCVKNRTIVQH